METSNKIIYGVLDHNGCHIDVSQSQRGAKMIATRDGYDAITVRLSNHYFARVEFRKRGKRWIRVSE